MAWKNENGKHRQKEFMARCDADELVAQIKAKGQPYTLSKFCKMTLWDRLWLATFTWGRFNVPMRWVFAAVLVLLAPVALLGHFR